MDIKNTLNNGTLTIELTGRLDTATAPELDSLIKSSLNGVTELVFDFTNLEYISSAGLRVLLSAQKAMNTQGSMVVKNASADIKEIFDITGFADILTLA